MPKPDFPCFTNGTSSRSSPLLGRTEKRTGPVDGTGPGRSDVVDREGPGSIPMEVHGGPVIPEGGSRPTVAANSEV